jgi:hypothetical protein
MAHTLAPVTGLRVKVDTVRPYYAPSARGRGGMQDVRYISGQFFVSLQQFWERRGDEMLERCGDKYPELMVACMTKLAQVTRVEVGAPGDFRRLGNKEAIAQKLEEKAGPQARKLFEKFVKDMEKRIPPPSTVLRDAAWG